MIILPKAIYRFKAIPIKIAQNILQSLKEQILISYGKQNKTKQTNNKQTPKIVKTVLNNNRTYGGITIPDLKLY